MGIARARDISVDHILRPWTGPVRELLLGSRTSIVVSDASTPFRDWARCSDSIVDALAGLGLVPDGTDQVVVARTRALSPKAVSEARSLGAEVVWSVRPEDRSLVPPGALRVTGPMLGTLTPATVRYSGSDPKARAVMADVAVLRAVNDTCRNVVALLHGRPVCDDALHPHGDELDVAMLDAALPFPVGLRGSEARAPADGDAALLLADVLDTGLGDLPGDAHNDALRRACERAAIVCRAAAATDPGESHESFALAARAAVRRGGEGLRAMLEAHAAGVAMEDIVGPDRG